MIENPNGCDLSRLRYKARQALWLLEHLYGTQGENFIIFHTNDGSHKAGSLHFKNRAFDGGPPKNHREQLLKSAKEMLGRDYDLLDEVDHWHLEYDPK